MRIIQAVLWRILSLLVLAYGGLMAYLSIQALANPETPNRFALFGDFGELLGAGVLIVLGVLGLWPFRAKKLGNVITFPGIHGQVTIELDSIEATLARVLSTRPEVKKIRVKVTPSEDSRRATVQADVLMRKGAEGASARETANRISDYLADAAENILGVEEVTQVNLNVRDILVDAKELSVTLAREALAKKDEAPAVAPGAAPEAPSPAADHASAQEALTTAAAAAAALEIHPTPPIEEEAPTPEPPIAVHLDTPSHEMEDVVSDNVKSDALKAEPLRLEPVEDVSFAALADEQDDTKPLKPFPE